MLLFISNVQLFLLFMLQSISILNPELRLDNTFYEHRKYSILKVLNSLPADTSRVLKRNFPIILNVNRQTFANWLNANKSDILEIPSIKLAAIAKVLNVKMEDLINIPITTNQIPEQIIQTPESITSKLGLVI